jgi:hypothetical protein
MCRPTLKVFYFVLFLDGFLLPFLGALFSSNICVFFGWFVVWLKKRNKKNRIRIDLDQVNYEGFEPTPLMIFKILHDWIKYDTLRLKFVWNQ